MSEPDDLPYADITREVHPGVARLTYPDGQYSGTNCDTYVYWRYAPGISEVRPGDELHHREWPGSLYIVSVPGPSGQAPLLVWDSDSRRMLEVYVLPQQRSVSHYQGEQALELSMLRFDFEDLKTKLEGLKNLGAVAATDSRQCWPRRGLGSSGGDRANTKFVLAPKLSSPHGGRDRKPKEKRKMKTKTVLASILIALSTVAAVASAAVESSILTGEMDGTVYQNHIDDDGDGVNGRSGTLTGREGVFKHIDAHVDQALIPPAEDCDYFFNYVPSGKLVFRTNSGDIIATEVDADQSLCPINADAVELTILWGTGAYAGATGTGSLSLPDDRVLQFDPITGLPVIVVINDGEYELRLD